MTFKSSTLRKRLPVRHKIIQNGTLIGDNDFSQTDLQAFVASGFDLPNWRGVIKQHADATNLYDVTYVTFEGGTSGSAVKTYKVDQFPTDLYYTETVDGFLGSLGSFGPSAAGSSSASNRAKGNFCRQAVKRISPFSGGTFIGELREAIHMIRHPAQALWNGVRAYVTESKKLRKRIGRRPFRRIAAQSWLESAYGWAPLVSDVKSGAEAVSRVVNGFRPNEHVVGGRETDKKQIAAPTYVTRSYNNISWRYLQSIWEEASYQVIGAVRINPVGSLRGNLETFGISWDQVLPTAWELLPFSFISDYFSNVGDVIESASMLNGRVVWCCETTKLKRVLQQSGHLAIQGGQALANCRVSASTFKGTVVQYKRSSLANPIPSLQFECPGVGSMKWLNLAALAEALRD